MKRTKRFPFTFYVTKKWTPFQNIWYNKINISLKIIHIFLKRYVRWRQSRLLKILFHQEGKKKENDKERETETPTCLQERENEAEEDSSFSTFFSKHATTLGRTRFSAAFLCFSFSPSRPRKFVSCDDTARTPIITSLRFPRGVDLMKIPRRVNNVSPPEPNELSN